MAAAPLKTNRGGLANAKVIAKFAACWAVMLWVAANDLAVNRVDRVLQEATYKVLAGFPSLGRYTENLYQDFTYILILTFAFTLTFGTLLSVLGAAARMVARARVRAGRADFLDSLRHWTAAHPSVTRALLAAPALSWVLRLTWPGPLDSGLDTAPGAYARIFPPLLLAAWGVFAMTKKGLRELLAPTVEGAGAPNSSPIGAREIAFDAVAVTRETLATVGVFATIVLGVPAFALLRTVHAGVSPVSDGLPSIFSFVAYVAFAATGAFMFRKASRIAVGLDGVHIHGTSRARFFAYRDIDSARQNGGSLELVRRGKVILRLQLHGEDAGRRDAVLARITENIARVREGRGAAAAEIVASSSKDDLARVADGAGGYRIATLTREQLWALVEGPEIAASARKAAAEALVRSNDPGERARLRVAAEHCAEPQVRIELQEIAEEGEVPELVAPLVVPSVARGGQ